MFFDMNVSNTKSKNLVLASPLKQNLNKIRNWLGAPELIMAPLTKGGVENTRLEAKAKDTKKIRDKGQEQPFREQTLSRPRTGMLEAQVKDQRLNVEVISKKKVFAPKLKNNAVLEPRTRHFRGLADFEAKAKDLIFEAKVKDFKLCLRGFHLCP